MMLLLLLSVPAHFYSDHSRLSWVTWSSTEEEFLGVQRHFSTNRLYRATGVWNILCRAMGQDTHNKTMKEYTKLKVISTLRTGFVEMISAVWKGVLGGVFLANHWASIDNLTRTTKRQNTYKCNTKCVPNKQQKTHSKNLS